MGALWCRLFIPLLMTYGLLFAEKDAFAVSQWISGQQPSYYALSVGVLLALYLACLAYLPSRLARSGAFLVWAVRCANLLIATVFVAALIKTANPLTAGSLAMHDGIPIFVIWLILFRDETGEIYLAAYLLIQMTLAGLVLAMPDLEFLDGRTYQRDRGAFTLDPTIDHGLVLDKLAVGDYGVFHNPNALGFYSATIVALGVYFVLKYRPFPLLLGWYCIALGAIGWVHSLTRGPAIALIGSAALVGVLAAVRQGGAKFLFVFSAGIFIGILLLIAPHDALEVLFPSVETASVTGRIDGLRDGWRAIETYPLLGAPSFGYWEGRTVPHFYPIYVAANFGVVAGSVASIFLLLFPCGVLVWLTRSYLRARCSAATFWKLTSVLAICLAIIVTNNIASPFLIWASIAQVVTSSSRMNFRPVQTRSTARR